MIAGLPMSSPLMAVVIVAFVGGCAAAPADEGGGLSGTGPLAGQKDTSAYILPAKLGAEFTDGFAVLQLSGDRPATILKIESIGGAATFKFLGAKISGPGRKYSAQQALPGWPAAGFGSRVVDAVGLRIDPIKKTFNQDGYEILMGYRRISSKPAIREGIRVTYKIGVRTYRAVLPSAFASCSPDQSDGDCLNGAYDLADKR